MAKPANTFVCQSCGAISAKWAGRCEACGEWNTIVEEATPARGIQNAGARGRPVELVGLKGDSSGPDRLLCGISELDRVSGGGLVPGSTVLVGGDPGIGKSTLVLQMLACLAMRSNRVLYVSGEEAISQVRLRASRLGLADAPVLLAAETNLADILATLSNNEPPALVAIDSIQTMWSPTLEAAPGTVSQLRATAEILVRFAKARGTCMVFIGHVTKEGQIAGPKLIEHMVDAVFYFEGERGHQFRILRAVKNRFGPTDEIGVFEMSDAGLREVENPSGLFIGDRDGLTPGSSVFAGIEGTRPMLVEIQALVSASTLGTPRRAVVGWDSNRLAMILAVLEAHCGLSFSGCDVYLNIAGGMRIREPAADLAVAAALVSSLAGTPLPPDAAIFGEVSLSGAVRPVALADARFKEAAKLGFKTAVVPARTATEHETAKGMTLKGVADLNKLVGWIATLAPAAAQPAPSGRPRTVTSGSKTP